MTCVNVGMATLSANGFVSSGRPFTHCAMKRRNPSRVDVYSVMVKCSQKAKCWEFGLTRSGLRHCGITAFMLREAF